MTSLQAVLLLFIGITFVAAMDDLKPNCSQCEFFSGIGFLPVPGKCEAYFMCFKKPYSNGYYRHQIMCCPVGSKWNQMHLTCQRDPKCQDSRECCPNTTTTTDLPCPFKEVEGEPSKYSYKATHEVMSCPYKSSFSLEFCTCIFDGPYPLPCWKILHFTFSHTYDSDSCYNFAVGIPYGKVPPPLDGKQLCLNGVDQLLKIPFLNNWFAWNPVANTFTICFWLRVPKDSSQTAGVLSTNCEDLKKINETVMELWLAGGNLYSNLGGQESDLNEIPDDKWNLICITFERGHYIVFYNALHIKQIWFNPPGKWKFTSHSDTTLGFIDDNRGFLKGYFDDVCFWTHVLLKPEIMDLFNDGPSAEGEIGPLGVEGA